MSHVSGKDIMYQPFVMSDIAVVELLIEYRYKYDENLFLENGSMFYVTGTKAINQELVVTYASLDETIKQCRFSSQQLQLIKLVEQGYTHREIASYINVSFQNIGKMLKTIYKAIVKQNLQQWRKVTYKTKLNLETKQCSKCEEHLPATDEFFTYDKTNDRFKSNCKSCR